jgi:hypothetical protein
MLHRLTCTALVILVLVAIQPASVTAASCANGAGGTFECANGKDGTMSDQELALAACESVYGSYCDTGTCSVFDMVAGLRLFGYYYDSTSVHCSDLKNQQDNLNSSTSIIDL